MSLWDGMGYTVGTGVATAQKIVKRPTTSLPRLPTLWVGRVIPKNNLPHGHVCTNIWNCQFTLKTMSLVHLLLTAMVSGRTSGWSLLLDNLLLGAASGPPILSASTPAIFNNCNFFIFICGWVGIGRGSSGVLWGLIVYRGFSTISHLGESQGRPQGVLGGCLVFF